MNYDYIKILRFDHWVKQIFVFPGFLYALYVINFNVNFGYNFFIKLFTSLLVVSLAASCNYVINEFIDGPNDKFHPLKKKRPGAQKKLNLKYVILLYLFLFFLVVSFSLIFLKIYFLIVIFIFLIMGFLYNLKPFRTKDIKYLDIISESINNPIRFFLGYFTIIENFNLDLISITDFEVVLFYFTFGCFLMSCKRLSEKRFFANYKNIKKYRITIFKYSENQLLIQTFFYSIISLLLLSNVLVFIDTNFFIFIVFSVITCMEYLNLTLNMSYSTQEPESLYKEKFFMFLILINSLIFFFIVKDNLKFNL